MFAWFKRRAAMSVDKPSAEPIVAAAESRPAPQCRPELPPYPVCLRLSAQLVDRDVAAGADPETATERHHDRMAAVIAAAGERPEFGNPEAEHAQQWLQEITIYWNSP